MSFLALVFGLILHRTWPAHRQVLQRDGWYLRWRAFVAGRQLPGAVALGLELLVPLIAVQLFFAAIAPLLFGLLWIAAAIAVLLYALGRENLSAEAERYRSQCRRGDFESALHGLQPSPPEGVEPAASAPAVHQQVQTALLYRTLQHWFAVVLYFLLLGPAGALGYRLLQLSLPDNTGARALAFYVDWVPARLTAAAFVLTGNFIDSIDELYDGIRQPGMPAPDLLYSVAMAATGQDRASVPAEAFGEFAARQNEIIQGLLRRSQVAWIAVVSLLVLV